MIRSRCPNVLAIIPLLPWLAAAVPAAAQNIETVDGVRVVHNEKGGLWGKAPKVALELVRKLGDVDTEDEHLAFNFPSDVAVDKAGHIYVLDTGNTRIQKFGPDGRYLATIGRKGQGPGEFILPDGLDIDRDGNLVVGDTAQSRLHVIIGDGKDARAIILKGERLYGVRCLADGGYVGRASTWIYPMRGQDTPKIADMRLFRRLTPEGRITSSYGVLNDFGETMTNALGNTTETAVGAGDALFVTYTTQNRVEKYGPDGLLIWRADRPLDYGTEVKKKGKFDTSGGGVSMSSPEMNTCSAGIAVDAKGRIWVLTYARQLKKDEQVQTSMMSVGGQAGVSNVSIKTEGNTDLRTTDALRLDVFDPDGSLLGEIPLSHFADVLRISGDDLFLIDRERGVTVYYYRIVEK
jgi:sugar lactone lactonase YvrE